MKTEQRRVCPNCGHEYAGEVELCPNCMLRGALDERSFSEEAETTLELKVGRFEHFEVVKGEDGKPVELGRGAMGVTYKAFDVNLRCPVTLKVVGERYLGDESARLRFLREARVAASLRHSNVASVLHLGRTENGYFYAMEFVEGETLENLIKRSGRLDAKLALEITAQIAAGLAAVHKKGLVHRDIKPSNIMVCFEEGGSPVAKIIDLGLAKTVGQSDSEASISMPGVFAGTPEFASPEQFAGVGVDIRSDLYALGVTLWKMLTGHAPFRGSSAEVMRQHQHAPLPLEQLEGVPQPLAVLLEVLLEKDAVRRFASPAELLKVIPTITGAIDSRRRVSCQSLRKTSPADSRGGSRRLPARLGPKKISVARLPITGSDVFGREEDIAFLDAAWSNRHINIVTIVAWAGVGKSTLLNHWLGRMAAENYRSAELVFGWSFYTQGTSGGTSSANQFFDETLAWFGDSNPQIGTAWEKGERLAKLIAHRRTLLILDGLEPLQNPPGSQEGRLRDPALQALLRELAAFNAGLCVITTRLPVADIADHERSSSPRRELERLSSDAGAKLLRALGVIGGEVELRSASDEFVGHCLALTLLGSYLTDAYNGNIRFRKEVSEHLSHDERQGGHARKVMESYQTWFGEGAELSVLRMLGLFDRPAHERAIGELLRSPAIPGLTESLTDLSQSQWRTILTKLRRAKLLAGEDSHSPGSLDTHPLVREYFGEQLRTRQVDAWKECNRRLFNHYRTLAPQLPDTFTEMEPLFLAVICGCNAGLLRDALHEVYLPRIQRGNAGFAANVLGARGALLQVLVHFFEDERWASPVKTGVEEQRLTAEDQLCILMQVAVNITAVRESALEAKMCYERAESLCHSLNRPLLLYVALMGRCRYSVVADKLGTAMPLAKQIYSLAVDQNEPTLMIGACAALAGLHCYAGDFATARQYTTRGLHIWRSGGLRSPFQEIDAQPIGCLSHEALIQWHFGEIPSYRATLAEAIALAKELNDMHGLAVTLGYAVGLAHSERSVAEVECTASDLIELSTRQSFAHWLPVGEVFRGWARSSSNKRDEGLAWIEAGMEDYRATGSISWVPYFLELKAEALHAANRTAEALQALEEAELLVERSGGRCVCVELHRLRGVFLAVIGGDELQIEASLGEAIRIAREQKSISLEKRAEATYAEYRRQRASGAVGVGLRLPLW